MLPYPHPLYFTLLVLKLTTLLTFLIILQEDPQFLFTFLQAKFYILYEHPLACVEELLEVVSFLHVFMA